MAAHRRVLLSIGLAILLLAGLWGLVGRAQGPGEAWLVRVPCRDEAGLRRLLAGGLRVVLWQEGQAYVVATAQGRNWIAAHGLLPQALSRRAAQGDYYVVYARAGEAEALRGRYGPPVALGEGYYLIGLPPGARPVWPGFAYRLPACLEAPRPPARALLEARAAAAALEGVVAEVSVERLRNDIAQLQDDDAQEGPDALRSRYTLTTSLDVEGQYIASELRSAGLQVEFFPFDCTRPVSNVIGILPGLRPESEGFYIVCGHYDSTAARTGGWSWSAMQAPGADDNASGTAAVLEAARALAGHPLVYGVRFCLFAGEEQGLVGSAAYAQALGDAGANILGVINLDMVGYDSDGDGRMELRVNNTAASRVLAEALARNVARFAPGLVPTVVTNTAYNSDHAAFWDQGYAAMLAMEDWGNHTPYYHTISDTLSTLNEGFSGDITRATVATLGELARLEPDLAASEKTVAFADLLHTRLAYTVALRNSGALTASATLTDVLPPELTLQGPVGASEGTASCDEEARRLGWAGDMAFRAVVTITFQALADPPLGQGTRVVNVAEVDDGLGGVYRLPAEVWVPYRLILPVVWKGASLP